MPSTKTSWSKYDTKPRLQLLSGDALSFDKERFSTTAKLLTNISPPRVKVVFNHQSMQKLRALCEECEIEIGALCLTDEKTLPDGTRVFKIYDVFVPLQECTHTTTTLLPNGIMELFHEFDTAFGLIKAKALKNKLSFWWHSHVNMGTGPSGQDERTFTERGSERQVSFMSIGNKQGDLHCNVKLKVPELSDWAQWEIRDIPWEKDWETIVAIKDEVHPLLLEEGQSPFHIRTFTDSKAGEIVRDPKIYEWAKQQVETKVKGLRTGYFSGKSQRSTLILPEELAAIKVDEYQVNQEQDLGEFVLELWGEKPPKPIPIPVVTTIVTETTVVTGDVVPAEVVAVPVAVEEDENDWLLDVFKQRSWWPKELTFRYYLKKTEPEENFLWVLPGVVIAIVFQFLIGWMVCKVGLGILKFFLWTWYATPIRWAARGIRKWNEGREEARKYREEKRGTSERRTGERIKPSITRRPYVPQRPAGRDGEE